MKKLPAQFLLLSSLLICSVTINAQDALKMGNRILGGGLSFGLQENTEDYLHSNSNSFWPNDHRSTNNSSFGISPYYGRLSKDHTMIGLKLRVSSTSYAWEHTNADYAYIREMNQDDMYFSFGTFLRYYFPVTERLGIYFEPNLGLSRSVSKRTDNNFDSLDVYTYRNETNNRLHSLYVDMRLGAYLFVLDQLTIETNLASMVLSAAKGKAEYRNLLTDKAHESNLAHSNINFNFINQFTFDQLFTINYYF